jgi:transcriptional regulator with XRE-family HTH domain
MDVDLKCFMQDKQLGEYLRAHRLRLDLTVTKVRVRTGIPAYRLRDLEEGKASPSIKLSEAKWLAILYGIPMAEIVRLATGEVGESHYS